MVKKGDDWERERMIRKHITARGVRDPRVLEVMQNIPRHLFVKDALRQEAYADFALPIEGGQTISQPYIVARMTELLDLSPTHKVLEIGTGSGYQTAILARLSRWVYSLERIPELARLAIQRMRELGIDNVKIQASDGTLGWSQAQPYDRILVTAAAPRAPEALLKQLADGGLLVIPEGGRETQRLMLYRRQGERIVQEPGEAVAFVPLIGRFGWQDSA